MCLEYHTPTRAQLRLQSMLLMYGEQTKTGKYVLQGREAEALPRLAAAVRYGLGSADSMSRAASCVQCLQTKADMATVKVRLAGWGTGALASLAEQLSIEGPISQET